MILKELKEPETQVQPQIMNIDEVISNLQSTITSLQGRREHVNNSEILELAMCLTAVKLGSAMKADESLLLPELHQTFQLEVQNCQCYFAPEVQLSPVKIPGNRWLLSHLHGYFGDILRVECTHRTYGSILLHRDCNIIKALYVALRQAHLYNKL